MARCLFPFTIIISCASKISRTCLSRARAREKFCLSAICHTLSVNLLYIKGLTAKIVWQIFRDLQSLTQKWPIFVLNHLISPLFLGVFLQVWADLWQIIVVFSSKKHLFCCNNHRYPVVPPQLSKVYNRYGTTVAKVMEQLFLL